MIFCVNWYVPFDLAAPQIHHTLNSGTISQMVSKAPVGFDNYDSMRIISKILSVASNRNPAPTSLIKEGHLLAEES